MLPRAVMVAFGAGLVTIALPPSAVTTQSVPLAQALSVAPARQPAQATEAVTFSVHVYLPRLFQRLGPDVGDVPGDTPTATATETPTPSATPGSIGTATASSTALASATAFGTGTSTAAGSPTPTASNSPTTAITATASPTPYLQVTFLNIGQGDSAWVHSSDGWDALIDGGNRGRGGDILAYLATQQVPELDVVVATHPDADHIGGLIGVVEGIAVTELWHNGQTATSGVYQDLATAVATRAIPTRVARDGQSYTWGCCVTAAVLNPPDPAGSNENNASIVLRVSLGERDFLFTGDAEDAAESRILDRLRRVDAEVLKVGHHGSKTSSSKRFLDAVLPYFAVISASLTNQYGHPHQETLTALTDVGAQIYCTHRHGHVVVTTDGRELTVAPATAQPPSATTCRAGTSTR